MKYARLSRYYFLKLVRFFRKRPEELVIAVVLVACYLVFGSLELKQSFESNNKYISNFTKWNNDLNLKRSIANLDNPECLDILNPNGLRSEIKRLETEFKFKEGFSGNWQGIELNSLPASQAKLLTDFGHLIGDKSFVQNFSKCDSVICVFNEIYQDKEKLAGLYIYYWYLKTGSMISLSNITPAQESKFPGIYNQKKFDLKDYLFSKDDLQKLVQVAYSLPDYLSYNPLLKSIVKIPDTSFERKDIKSCINLMRSGSALINVNCLSHSSEFGEKIIDTIISYNDLYYGEIYKSSSLTASHHFLDLGLWEEESFLGEDLSWNHLWTSSLPSNYSLEKIKGTSPEDFYQTLISSYVYNPAYFQQNISMDISRFVKTELFDGVGFDTLTLSENTLSESINAWDYKEIKLWKNCIDKFYKGSHRKVASISSDDPLYGCYKEDIEKFQVLEEEKLATSNNGCRFLKSDDFELGRKKYHSGLKQYITEKLVQHKFELETFKDKAIEFQNARLEFKNNIDPVYALINCDLASNKKECFELFLTDKAQDILENNHINSPALIKKGIQEMLTLYPYELTARKTKELIAKFISPYYIRSYFSGQKLVEACKKVPLNQKEKLKFPLIFSGGMRYIEATTLNCINDSLPEIIQDVIEEETRIELSSIEKGFVEKNLRKYFSNTLEGILERDETFEKQRLAIRFENIEEEFLTKLKNSDNIIKESYSEKDLKKKCLQEVREASNQRVFYHSDEEINQEFGIKICANYLNDEKVESKLKKEIEQKWQSSLNWAEEAYKSVYSLEIQKCQDRYPAATESKFKNTRLKEICVNDAKNFAGLHTRSLWKDRPEGTPFENRINQFEFK